MSGFSNSPLSKLYQSLDLKSLGSVPYLKTVILAVLLSVFAAFLSIGFIYLYEFFAKLFYFYIGGLFGEEQSFNILSSKGFLNGSYMPFLILPLVGVIVSLVMYFFMPNKSHAGVPHILSALHVKFGKMSLKEGIGVGIIASLGVGSGASVGRFGPVVHISASILSFFGQALKLDRQSRVILMASGIAGGISAAFGTPLGAVLFTHEALLRHSSLRTMVPTLLSAFVGRAIGAHFFPHQFYTGFPLPTSIAPQDYLPILLLAALGAFATWLYRQALIQAAKTYVKTPLPFWVKPIIGGLLLAVIAFIFPQTLGLSIPLSKSLLGGSGIELGMLFVAGIFFAKVLSIFLSFASGFSGGVVGPALALGNILGAFVAVLYAKITGSDISTLLVIVGAAVVLSNFFGAPISMFVISLEFAQDMSIALPLTLALGVSHLVHFYLIKTRSHFEGALAAFGADLANPLPSSVMNQYQATHLMYQVGTVAQDGDRETFEKAFKNNRDSRVYVTDEKGKFLGVACSFEKMQKPFPVTMIMGTNKLTEVKDAFISTGECFLAVMDAQGGFLGEIRANDLLSLNAKLHTQARIEEGGVG